jgi:NADPH-dependent 2,4-dienoyl-CoA reductase/sulfur reductase-like enzyme
MGTKKVVIVGASHSGISAAINLKKALKDKAEIILLESSDGTGLSFVGADGLLWIEDLITKKHLGYITSDKINSFGINFHLNEKVIKIDSINKKIITISSEFSYDYVVLATGSSPNIPEFAKEYLNKLDYRLASFTYR